MYATVKELHDDTVLLEVAPGVHAIYAKNAIGAVLDDAEYNRIVHGDTPPELDVDGAVVPDDASSLTGLDHAEADDAKTDLVKKTDADKGDEAEVKAEDDKKSDGKADGEADAK